MTSQTSQIQGEQAMPSPSQQSDRRTDETLSQTDSKRRRIMGLLKKRESGDSEGQKHATTFQEGAPTSAPFTSDTSSSKRVWSPTSAPMQSPPQPMTPTSNPRDGTISPRSPLSASASPSRLPMRSPSPRLLSPASSLIFERNVQESGIPDDYSAAIPTHIQTDNHIPPVLEASSFAITNSHLDPSEVQIAMHPAHMSAHQSIAASTSHSDQPLSPALSMQHSQELLDHTMEDSTSPALSYGGFDTADPRRLSFVSFADVVQAENLESGTGSMSASSIFPVTPSSPVRNRSPSPMRSIGSSSSLQQPFSPSAPSSVKGIAIARSPPMPMSPDSVGFSGLSASPAGGELVLEKMSSALKAVETADLLESGATR